MDELLNALLGGNLVVLLLALFLILCIFLAIRIVPQSEQHVVERFGRLKSVLGPGINFIVPFLDRVAHKVSILERQLPNASQDAITADNVLVQIDTSVFYRILEPEKTVYRIRDVDGAIATTVAGIVRAEIGKMELDEVQSNRSMLISRRSRRASRTRSTTGGSR
jgi:regulator of protease activity HflC (stomatin/prohibitin superfamily)